MRWRSSKPARTHGRALVATGDLLAYVREASGRRFPVVPNLGARPDTLAHAIPAAGGHLIPSIHPDRQDAAVGAGVALALRPDEGALIALPVVWSAP